MYTITGAIREFGLWACVFTPNFTSRHIYLAYYSPIQKLFEELYSLYFIQNLA